MGINIGVKRLLWVAENFFELDGVKFHELNFAYLVDFDSDIKIEKKKADTEIFKQVEFRWFDVTDIEKLSIKPDFLSKEIKNILDNNNMKHIVNMDDVT